MRHCLSQCALHCKYAVLSKYIEFHYIDVIMTTMASQITSLAVVYSTVYSEADQRKHRSSASLVFVWGIHRYRWIPRTKSQLRGKCIHLMTSSCYRRYPLLGKAAKITATDQEFSSCWINFHLSHGLLPIYSRTIALPIILQYHMYRGNCKGRILNWQSTRQTFWEMRLSIAFRWMRMIVGQISHITMTS